MMTRCPAALRPPSAALLAAMLLALPAAGAAEAPATPTTPPGAAAAAAPPAVAPPASARPATTPAPAAAPGAAQASGDKAVDRVDLGTTVVTGNRELPRVLYVVPWKAATPGDLSGRPSSSLLDEALEPVDRTVFQRQLRYFNALQPRPAAAPGTP